MRKCTLEGSKQPQYKQDNVSKKDGYQRKYLGNEISNQQHVFAKSFSGVQM